MANMNKIDLLGAMYMILGIMAVYGTYKVLSFIYLLIIGSTANVATSGDITVTNTTNNTITAVDTSVGTGFTSLISAEGIVLGLIALVVIVKVFWPLISAYIPKKKGGGGLN